VNQWSREARRQVRQESFRAYFQNAERSVFMLSHMSLQNIFLGSGARLSAKQLTDVSSTLDADVVYGERCSDGLYLVVKGNFRGDHLYILEDAFQVERIYLMPLTDFDHRLLGLCDAANDLLALGLLEHIDWAGERLSVLTPLAKDLLNQVKVVQFGSLRVDRLGQEYWLGWGQ
jgi:polynucleotide 5'-hydroxyl-kinase GRC3/NOL9